jgi:hypothetical protein
MSVLERQQAAAAGDMVLKPTADVIKRLILSWIITNDLPFTAVECQYIRTLHRLLNRQLSTSIPTTGDTIKSWVVERYEQEKDTLKATLLASPFRKHLSFGTWSSPNSAAMLAIIAHVVDADHKLQTSLFSFWRCAGK